jgi:hypothetical protein
MLAVQWPDRRRLVERLCRELWRIRSISPDALVLGESIVTVASDSSLRHVALRLLTEAGSAAEANSATIETVFKLAFEVEPERSAVEWLCSCVKQKGGDISEWVKRIQDSGR